ncbi:MAG: periplasmic heavy metal sensor, partial [Chitinophagaceae bacterium]|nr:periplasmic heavy metal sensor [Chitinophagaceae bacterium]
MKNAIKNKFFTWLVATLLVANAVTILFFWINRPERMQGPKGSPREFLVHALELDSSQLDAFQALIEEHQASARPLKNEIRSAKENLFQLLKQPIIP